MHWKNKAILGALCALSAAALQADLVETKDGARLVGKITKTDGGTVYLATAYAGEVAIKQAEISSLTTDTPISVRLASGTRIDGTVSTSNGEVKVNGVDGQVSTTVDKVAASWAAGGEDPIIVASRRHWTFQTAGDIVGKDGNTKSTAVGLSFVAGLVSPQDALKFYGSYNYATTENTAGVETKSSDEAKGGIDYSSFFTPRYGWYVRSELEKDDVEGIDLRSTSDFGGTVRFIHNDVQSLVGRLGAGYRFESYPSGPNNKGAVLSTGLSHSYVINKHASIATELQYIPAVDDFADYRFVHDTGIVVPISAGFWKLRIGINNQYNSRPLKGREELDTTYYTRLILNWK